MNRIRTTALGVVAILFLAACSSASLSAAGPPAPTSQAPAPPAPTETGFPVVQGFAKGASVDYLLEEVSDKKTAEFLSEKTGFPVPYNARLADVPSGSLSTLYLFMNGVDGPNPFGFQANVLDSVPGDPAYSPLWLHTFVTWNDGAKPKVLKSEDEILAAEQAGDVTLERSDLVINCPVIPDGQTGFPLVTGFAHGESVDYLLEEVSDQDTATFLGDKTGFPVPFAPALAATTPAAANLYLFMNGVSGPNPFGFQPNILDSVPGDPGYSPLWLHVFVKWNADAQPRLLKSEEEILSAEQAGELTLEGSDLIINCPVIPSNA